MGGGILCLKALPNLPQQGKRETKLFKQQIVLRSRVKVNVDVEFQVHLSTGCQLSRRWQDVADAPTPKGQGTQDYKISNRAEVVDGVETTTPEFCGAVAGATRCDDDST